MALRERESILQVKPRWITSKDLFECVIIIIF